MCIYTILFNDRIYIMLFFISWHACQPRRLLCCACLQIFTTCTRYFFKVHVTVLVRVLTLSECCFVCCPSPFLQAVCQPLLAILMTSLYCPDGNFSRHSARILTVVLPQVREEGLPARLQLQLFPDGFCK